MPFLFVDYDQGAGGEFFCSQLSQTPQCNKLSSLSTETDRTKVTDVFNQAWLDTALEVVYRESDPEKYDVVPCHRRTPEAKKILKNVQCIRISNPTDDHLWSFLKHNQKIKTLLTTQKQNSAHFVGELKLYVKKSGSNDWVKKVNASTTYLDIKLLSKNIEPSESTRLEYIREFYNTRPGDPHCDWDLVIPYEKFFFNTDWIVRQLKEIFGIELSANALDKYRKNYVDFTFNTAT